MENLDKCDLEQEFFFEIYNFIHIHFKGHCSLDDSVARLTRDGKLMEYRRETKINIYIVFILDIKWPIVVTNYFSLL